MITINAKIRKGRGKSASRRLRAVNKCPAIIYGGNAAPTPIILEHEEIWNAQFKNEFYSEIIILIIEEKKEEVKVQAIQRHAYKAKLNHIDFLRVDH